jgi:hypothetical protein
MKIFLQRNLNTLIYIGSFKVKINNIPESVYPVYNKNTFQSYNYPHDYVHFTKLIHYRKFKGN